MIPSPRGMLDSVGDFFYKRRLTNRRGVFGAAPLFSRPRDAQVAQLVEQRTENPRVGGSIPPLGTIFTIHFNMLCRHIKGGGAVLFMEQP